MSLLVHHNVTVLTICDIIGYIVFCTIESNGCQLVIGLMDRICSQRSMYKGHIKRFGLYHILMEMAQSLAKKRGGIDIPFTSSENKRFNFPTSHVPMVCSCDIGKSNAHEMSNEECQISQSVRKIYQLFTILWVDIIKNRHNLVKVNRIGSVPKCSSNIIDRICQNFLRGLNKIENCNNERANQFFEMSSMYGLLPYEVIGWCNVSYTSSLAYKYMSMTLSDKSDKSHLSIHDAQSLLWDCKSILQNLYNRHVTLSILDCIFTRLYEELYHDGNELCRKQYTKQMDVFVRSRHNNNRINSIFRLKFMDKDAYMEMMPHNQSCKFLSLPKNGRHSRLEICCFPSQIFENKKKRKHPSYSTDVSENNNQHGFISWSKYTRSGCPSFNSTWIVSKECYMIM